jgi:hypothetical protein
MLNAQNNTIQTICESTFKTLDELETVLKFTQEICINYENISNYYNLSSEETINLSKERNSYINMLALALERISMLRHSNLLIEKSFRNL